MVGKKLLKRPMQSKTEQVIESLTELILTGDLGKPFDPAPRERDVQAPGRQPKHLS